MVHHLNDIIPAAFKIVWIYSWKSSVPWVSWERELQPPNDFVSSKFPRFFSGLERLDEKPLTSSWPKELKLQEIEGGNADNDDYDEDDDDYFEYDDEDDEYDEEEDEYDDDYYDEEIYENEVSRPNGLFCN